MCVPSELKRAVLNFSGLLRELKLEHIVYTVVLRKHCCVNYSCFLINMISLITWVYTYQSILVQKWYKIRSWSRFMGSNQRKLFKPASIKFKPD